MSLCHHFRSAQCQQEELLSSLAGQLSPFLPSHEHSGSAQRQGGKFLVDNSQE